MSDIGFDPGLATSVMEHVHICNGIEAARRSNLVELFCREAYPARSVTFDRIVFRRHKFRGGSNLGGQSSDHVDRKSATANQPAPATDRTTTW
jgi:hypothetical protein